MLYRTVLLHYDGLLFIYFFFQSISGDFLVKPSFDEQLQSLAEELESFQSLAEKELSKAARDLGMDAGKTIKLENNNQNGFCLR